MTTLLAGATTMPACAQNAGPPVPPPPASSNAPDAIVQAKRLLAEMTVAYKSAPVYSDRVVIRHTYAGAARAPIESMMLLGPGTDARINTSGNEVIAADGRVTVTYPQYKDRYLEVPLERDVIYTVAKLFGRYGGPMGPAAFRYGKSVDELVSVLGYGLPDKPRISGYREITTVDNEPRQQISLISASGSVAVNVDPATKFLDTIALEYVDPSAPVPNFRVTLEMDFNPKVLDKLPEPISFDPAGRLAFRERGALAGKAGADNLRHVKVGPGDPAPEFTVFTIEGAKVRLADLRGSMVVLCFWAAGMKDGQASMHVMQELADWSQASASPVQVWPIHSMGRGEKSELWERAVQYWDNHPFTFGCLLDEHNVVAKAFGITGVPMVVLIDREGNVVNVRSGLVHINAEAIKKDILAALGLSAPGS